MATQVEKSGRKVIRLRAVRLLRLIDMEAPDMILCAEAALVYKAACMINPQEAGVALAKSLRENWAYEKHLCMICLDAPAAKDDHLCAKCLEEICAKCLEEIKRDSEDPEDDDPHASSRAPWKE